MNGFEVDLDRLDAEVSNAFAVADAIDAGVDAGLAAQKMSEDAFGLLCLAMVPPSQVVQGAAVAALKAEARAYEALAMNLRNAATDYATADAAAASKLRVILGRLS